MKRLAGIVIVLIAFLIMIATPVFADTPLPDSDPTVQSIHVYQNLLETDDRLFIIYANIPYADLTGMEPVTKTLLWQLVDGTTGDVLGSTTGYAYVYYGYRYQVFSMYFAASEGIAWDPVEAYIMRLRGNPLQFDDPPVYDFTVQSGDFTSLIDSTAIRAALASDILVIAEDLDLQWGLDVSLITEDEAGQTLSTFGQAYFRGTIYGIQAMAPALFPLAVQNIDIEDREWTDAYVSQLEEQYGDPGDTWIATAKAAGGALFGVDFDLLSLIILLAMCAGLVVANVYLTNDHWNGLIDAAFIIVIGAKIGLIGLGYVGLMAAIAVLYFSMRIWGLVRG